MIGSRFGACSIELYRFRRMEDTLEFALGLLLLPSSACRTRLADGVD